MLIHLIEAFKRTHHVVIDDTFHDFVFDDGLVRIPVKGDLHVRMTLEQIGKEEVLVQGLAQATFQLACDRCTKGIDYNLNCEFNRCLKLMDEEECAYLDGVVLDVRKFINIEFLSEFPQKVLCNDECKGLCYECGVDLNNEECTCDRGHVDIRMAHLKDLFDSNFKEV
jgi:uncharacterized protein